MFVLSQIFGGCIFIVLAGIIFAHSQVRILAIFATANVFYCLSYLCIEDWVGFGMYAVGFSRAFTFMLLLIFADKVPKWSRWVALVMFLSAAVIIMCFTYEVWFDWCVLAVQLLLIYGCWQKNPHVCHGLSVLFSFVLVIHNLRVENWILVATELTVIGATAIFYIRYIARIGSRSLTLPPKVVS